MQDTSLRFKVDFLCKLLLVASPVPLVQRLSKPRRFVFATLEINVLISVEFAYLGSNTVVPRCFAEVVNLHDHETYYLIIKKSVKFS